MAPVITTPTSCFGSRKASRKIPLTLTERVPGWNGVELPDGTTGYISADWTQVLESAPASSTKATPEMLADSTGETDDGQDDEAESATGEDSAVAAATEPASAEEQTLGRH